MHSTRSAGAARPRAGPDLLLEPDRGPVGSGRLPRRTDRAHQGRLDGPDPATRRLPLRRPDRYRQDGAGEVARGVPLRFARPPRPPGHERVPDGGQPGAIAGRPARAVRGRRVDLVRPEQPVLGRAAGRVREGAPEHLEHLPAALRRRPADRPARSDVGLSAVRRHPDLEPRCRGGARHAARLRLRGEPAVPAGGGRADRLKGVPARAHQPDRQDRRLSSVRARSDPRSARARARAGPRASWVSWPAVGCRVGRGGPRVPRRERLQRGARRPPVEACGRALPARAARERDRLAQLSGR